MPSLPTNPVSDIKKKRNYEPILIEAFDENDPDTTSATAAAVATSTSLNYSSPGVTGNPNSSSSSSSSSSSQWKILACFWTLGLLNNTSYVIMLACAKRISEGGTGLVFLANVIPSLTIKATAPYWFHNVSYHTRLYCATIFMTTSFLLVAAGSSSYWALSSSSSSSSLKLAIQLLGVAFGSAQCGLGESSLLALAGKSDAVLQNNSNNNNNDNQTTTTNGGGNGNGKGKGKCLTCFSSGTGMAGVFGFFWKWFLSDLLGFSMSTTLLLALSLAIGYWTTFRYAMVHQGGSIEQDDQRLQARFEASSSSAMTLLSLSPSSSSPLSDDLGEIAMTPTETLALNNNYDSNNNNNNTQNDNDIEQEDQGLDNNYNNTNYTEIQDGTDNNNTNNTDNNNVMEISKMTGRQRFWLVVSLWPYMIPLFVVYAAEYALQSGTWSAIGFPVEDVQARNRFYQYSNWMYQVGVFLSRSSGTLFTTPLWVLWLMPALQTENLVLFCYVAAHAEFTLALYQPAILYAGAFYTGLLGGAVYINGYTRICADLPLAHREFALSATSVAEGLGVVVADAVGLVIQSCLYQKNGLDGAIVSCPLK